jgi:hypothetical protein
VLKDALHEGVRASTAESETGSTNIVPCLHIALPAQLLGVDVQMPFFDMGSVVD